MKLIPNGLPLSHRLVQHSTPMGNVFALGFGFGFVVDVNDTETQNWSRYREGETEEHSALNGASI